MADVTWTFDGDGSWDTASNWSDNAVPVAGDTVDLASAAAGPYVVSVTGDDACGTLNINNANAELFISTGGVMTADAINLNQGELFLQGLISGATISTNGGVFRADDGEMDNVTWDGTLALDGGKSTSFDNTLLVKNLALGSGSSVEITGYDAELDVSGDMTLGSGATPITLGGAGDSDYIKAVGATTLTIAGVLIADAKGSNVFLEDDGSGTIINAGDMTFGDPVLKQGGAGEIDPSNFDNKGLLTIANKTVDITSNGVFTGGANVGGFTNDATGVIALAGGALTVHDNGTVFAVNGSVSLTNKSKLTFYHSATGDGVISLSGGSLADMYNYTGSVNFVDNVERLWLENVSAFKGEILDDQIGDTIDFRNVAYQAGETVTLAAGGPGADLVSIHGPGGGVIASVKLSTLDDSYNAADFTLNQDPSLDLVVGLTRHVVHDFNGDGTSDLLGVNAAHQIADWSIALGHLGTKTVVGSAAGLKFEGTGDFKNNGTSDLLFANGSNALQVWNMSGGVRSGAPVSVGGPTMTAAWAVAAVGDFNGDGTSDILWRNATTGAVQVWKIANDKYVSSVAHVSPGAGYVVKGAADFNGDGVSDILWQNKTTHVLLEWQMKNDGVQAQHVLSSVPNTDVFVGVGDFKGNGTSEALFETAAHALVAYNPATGSTFGLGVSVPTGFTVASIGDFNNDGVSDILAYKAATGATEISLGTPTGHHNPFAASGSLAPPGWSVLA